ncbi:MAG: hypothetical protein ACHQ6U_08145 [Thermodesulfobacteriota bacterium]
MLRLQDSTQLPLCFGLQHCAPVSVLRQQHCWAEQVSVPQLAIATRIPDVGVKSSKEYKSGESPSFTKLTSWGCCDLAG